MDHAAIQHAVEDFWLKRGAQSGALADGGKAGGGARANGHMGPLTATDTHAAQVNNQAFGEVPPWLGYVFVLAETPETESVPPERKMLFPCDPVYFGMTYNQRYQEMLRRFIGDNVYQAGWFMTTKMTPEAITYAEPLATATALAFQTAIRGRIEFIKAVVTGRGTDRPTLM